MISIKKISPSSSAAQTLFALLDKHNVAHCPPDTCHLTQPEELEKNHSTLLGVFCDDILIGMGGLKFHSTYAEITRMFLKPEYRGNGLAVQLLHKLEIISENNSYKVLKLETSTEFKPAFKLYLRYGFELCEPFGEHINQANTYMKKKVCV